MVSSSAYEEESHAVHPILSSARYKKEARERSPKLAALITARVGVCREVFGLHASQIAEGWPEVENSDELGKSWPDDEPNKAKLAIPFFTMPISLTLKQKLSNLARSQSAPASPAPSSATLFSARRNILNFAWRGDRTSDESSQDYSNPAIGEEEFDNLMQKVIRQSGLDFEYVICCATVAAANHCGRTRPMSVFFSAPVA